ncbi:MAG: UDP-N-acetylmuramoyl-tripeptide--D-alanyl-D-alanine ligase [Candidatus Latescibacteria bacterium]|nr:UDP-N-acetylmuramoyl-tripeptide--D-alanyl-D-alanine ligase [Candidatus Latescibacterota bacterium]NIM21076.1 UDP-N-acetylmuramoyl-tripeptide--D-alanyl-D-alanine ligase [Candidatus Latescibacterota bacterium]NIM65211.1 UDP-N-acetylmuramoyl-tripeptide--D-alanyl-D-alanine ligase [Candidatus Latescibacterota bacterium]NIO01726.1 UDP-N-acetylmuramoyl-tripeptide--D-alanyl-D-alanine ligase [Candidatus Latescibacterota bacterium]NIO28243.1 UDP-N-acetylmuramoyl-tripeptide--D-alanyl-D-alanine ligase [
MSVRMLGWVVEALEDIGGLVIRSSPASRGKEMWFGATVDTRKECSGRIFFAFKGENTNGHRFAGEAISRGCVAAVVEDEETARWIEQTGAASILVKDTLQALQELARAYRNTLDVTVVAITGSSGKTTTKEFTRSILKRKYRVHGSPDSFNSRIGVPLTILETGEENEYLVLEVGANQKGEIDFLAALLKPDISVITNIGEAHIGFFGSPEGVASAKAELLDHMGTNGYVLLPGDDDFLPLLKSRSKCRYFTFGFSESCNYRITDVKGGTERTEFCFNGEPMAVRMTGKHNLKNAAAALAVGDLCGVEIKLSREGLLESEPLFGRGKVRRESGVTVIDDSYNANPSSMRASLDTLMEFDAKRRIAVLGEMKELGDYTQSCHSDLGAYLATIALDRIFWIGESSGDVTEAYQLKGGKASLSVFVDLKELVQTLKRELRPGDAVLVKGSRACGLERVVDGLLAATKMGEES